MTQLPSLYIFADEAGNLDFSNTGSEYFIVCAVTMRSLEVGHRLLDLRHELTLSGIDTEAFHATTDRQAVRDRVYQLIQSAQLDIDAIALHKRKTFPRIAQNAGYFYQLAWHLLLKHMAPRRCQPDDHLLVAASTLTTREKKARFRLALESVVKQHNVCQSFGIGLWGAATHPCLQIADYCAWAIQRWRERDDQRSYDLIRHQVRSYFEPFSFSKIAYY